MDRETVGIIGLGLLGSAVAERIAASGRAVVGYDVDPECCRHLADIGATPQSSVREVFDSAAIVGLVLPNSDVARTVIEDAGAIRPRTTILDMTTGDPDDMAKMGADLAARNVSYIDATVGGSSEQARQRDAIVMAGGETAAVDRCRDLLATFAREVFHVGPCGAGARMKLAMNLVLGLNRAALAEGLAFARACGLSVDDAFEAFRAGPAYSRAMDIKGRRMIEHDFRPVARLSQHRKDVDLILAAAARTGARTPLSRLHRDLLVQVEKAGFGGEDNSAIIRAFETGS